MFYKKQLITGMLGLGMKQYVNEPTKITQNSRTIIDLVFANTRMKLQLEHTPKITDHAWIKIEVGTCKRENRQREFKCRKYDKIDVKEFTVILKYSVRGWTNENIHRRAKMLVDGMVDALDIVTPEKVVKIPGVWVGKNGTQMR